VGLLLAGTGVELDSLDSDGRTPLLYGTRCEWEQDGIVKQLLEQEGVDPGLPNNDGRTPLLFPAEEGVRSVVKLLLECGGVGPNLGMSGGGYPCRLMPLEDILVWASYFCDKGIFTPIHRMTMAERLYHMLSRRGHRMW